jgi:tetratricopeptide (TPR) repeat protein
MKRGYKGKILLFGFMLLMTPLAMRAQDEKEYIRKGNRQYKKGGYSESESMYRRAENQEKSTADAVFNLGDALYKQGRYSEAATEFDRASEGYSDPARKAEGLYNLGNALLKDQKYKESIEAYINSLTLEPDNPAAKHNLAYAQEELKKQEEQQKQQDQQQQDQNKDKSEENQDKKNEQQNQEDQQQDQKQPEPQQGTMSREDAKRLLEALSAAEKKTQEKVQKEKARGAKTRVIKNW